MWKAEGSETIEIGRKAFFDSAGRQAAVEPVVSFHVN